MNDALVEVEPDGVRALRAGQMQLRSMLQSKYSECLEEYLRKLHLETVAFPDDEGLIDRNTRLACDLHAHRLHRHRRPELWNRRLDVRSDTCKPRPGVSSRASCG